MSDSKEILAVGSIAFDTIHTPKGNRDKILGGSSTYFSVASSRYGTVSLIGIVGEDFTDSDWKLFKDYNINIDSVEVCKGDTFSWGGKYNNDYSQRDTLFTNLGVFENFKPTIKTKYNNPILYLGNIQPELQFDVINKVDNPYLIAADSMNLWIDLFPQDVIELIKKVNIFLLNDEEAMQLTGMTNLEKIADQFLAYGPEMVIIKKGGSGSLLAFENKKVNISVVPNTPVLDPTGAGDSFAGGFLGYISKFGLDNPINAVVHGTVTASYTVSGFGLEKLCTIKDDDFNNKIKEVKIS